MTISSVRANWDAIVIGGGHNGLVAAAYLAKAGKSVLVLERNTTVGGATTSQRVFPDYDALLSRYAYLISLFPQRITEELGLDFKTRRRTTASFTPWTDSSGYARGLVLSNVDPQRSRDSLKELTGDDSGWNGLQRLYQLETALADLAWPSLLEPLQSREQFRNQLKTDDQRSAWRAFVERPVGEIIEELFDNDVLRGLLITDSKIGVFTHPHDPSLLQNRCFLYHVIGGGTGEWRVPIGGMRSLVESLERACKSAGAEILTSAPAIAIGIGSTQHSVTFRWRDQEHTVQAEHVLVNAGPRTFSKLIGEPWEPVETDEGSVVKMNMLLKRLPKVQAAGVTSEEAFAGSLHIDEGYDWMAKAYQIAADRRVPDPPPCEIYCHTLTDPSILSPELQSAGYQTLTLFGLDVPYRLFEQDHDAKKEQLRDLYLAGIQRLCAEPLADCLALDRHGQPCIEIKTPQELEREVDLDLGNIFHNTLSWFFTDDDEQVGRWGVETKHSRIYRAGSSAHRGGAVSGIPGRNAAMCVLGMN